MGIPTDVKRALGSIALKALMNVSLCWPLEVAPAHIYPNGIKEWRGEPNTEA